MCHQPVAVLFRQVDDLRDEQGLRGQPSGVERLAHRLEHQPFVRRMLVDDDEPVVRLRHDVVLVQLRPRSPQPVV